MASIFSFIRNPQLAGDLASSVVKDELGTLATKGKRYLPGIGFFIGGLVVALGAAVLVVLGLLEVLSYVLPFWVAALLLGISLGLVAFGLIYQARASFVAAAAEDVEEIQG